MSDYSATFPSQRPVFSQDFAQSGKIDPRATFSRSDSPIDTGKAAAAAVHYWSNEKHISSDNLLLQSSDFDTTWSANGLNGTPTSGQADPAGGTDGFTLVEDSSTGIHRISQNVTASGGLALTVYAKQNSGTRYLTLALYYATGNTAMAVYDLAGGSPVTATGASSTYTSVSASQTASGDSYDVATTVGLDTNWGTKSYTGDNSSSLDIAFASLTSTGATDYQATTTQIHREYAPTLKSPATAGDPRFEYDPVTNVSRGILIESQSSNELSYSENFDDSYWFKSDTTVQLNAGISPAGDLTADLVTADSTGSAGIHYLGKPFAFTSGNTYTFSVYVKGVNSTEFTLQGGNTSTYAAATQFTLTGAGSASSTTGSATIESVGNDWYRCSVTGTALATTSTTAMFKLISGGTGTFDGDDFSGVLLWGAQLEQSSHPSSYISTLLSAKTRAADSLSVATADIGYTGGPVSIVAEGEGGRGSYPRLFSMGDLSSYLTFFRLGSAASASTAYKFWVYDSGTQQADLNEEASVTKVAVSVDTNSVKSCGDGGTVQSDTSAVIPILTSLRIGDQPTGGKQWNGHVKRVAIYNEALTDTNLQALTS
jgi:hypothetical protein